MACVFVWEGWRGQQDALSRNPEEVNNFERLDIYSGDCFEMYKC